MRLSFALPLVLAFLSYTEYVKAKHETCERTYKRLGCYEEDTRGMTTLFNDRMERDIDWWNIEAYMHGLACRCANEARKAGLPGFALHYYGECYGRTQKQITALSVKEAKHHKCVGDQKYTVCKEEHKECVGREWAEAVYIFQLSAEEDVDGGLGTWQTWTTCDKECGSGFQHRERNCDNPVPKGKGKDCGDLEVLSERKPCKIKECPVNGGYGAWGNYGTCTKTCGGGTAVRSRPCNNPSPAHGGEDCSKIGPSTETKSCNPNPCPVNGGYGAWGNYGTCTKTCGGGTAVRSRPCNNPSPAHGGEDCSKIGPSTETKSCSPNPCPVNGGWGTWKPYGSCNKNCGGGSQTRTRPCNNPAPAYDGANCHGPASSTKSCNTEVCPSLGNCWTAYTVYQTHSGGNMVYIDRHRLNCGSSGNVLTMFHMQRDGGSMRYQYKCCKFQGSVCSLKKMTTTFNKDGDGDAVYLDRHAAECGNTGLINDMKVERNSAHDKIRYSYYCCNVNAAKWKTSVGCYTGYTSYTDDGDGKVYYLDRQTVSCASGYAISYFRLQRNSGHTKWRYEYRCCKINY